MNEKPPRPSRRLRSTLDRVLVHDIKNMGFRLQLLLSNLEEHYDDPDFKRSIRDLLASTIQRLDGIVGRYSAHPDAVLIKLALDLNSVIRVAAESSSRRGEAGGGPHHPLAPVFLALGDVPEIWADPYYLGDAFSSLIENAREAAGPEGRVVVRSFREEGKRRPLAVVEIIDNGEGMTADFLRDRLFRPFQTTKPDGVGLGMATASEILRFHRGTIRVRSQAGGGTLVQLKLPGSPKPSSEEELPSEPPACEG
jgi:signal transduction histidine kinase